MEISYHEIGKSDKEQIEDALPVWLQEVRELLPEIPEDLEVLFDNRYLIDEVGTGGFAAAKNRIVLAFDPYFADKDSQFEDLRGSLYHECFHLVQDWTGETTQNRDVPAIENAIMEGAATVFERERTGAIPLWSDYSDLEDIERTISHVKELGSDYDWQKWKFYDPDTDTRWILYKTGVYIVDAALVGNDLSIEDVAHMGATEILKASGKA